MSFLHQWWEEANSLVLQLRIERAAGLSLGQFQLHNQSGGCPSHLQLYGRGFSWSQNHGSMVGGPSREALHWAGSLSPHSSGPSWLQHEQWDFSLWSLQHVALAPCSLDQVHSWTQCFTWCSLWRWQQHKLPSPEKSSTPSGGAPSPTSSHL